VKSNIGEAGSRRPEGLQETGYRMPEPGGPPPKGAIRFGDSWMDPEEAGRYVLEAIKADRLFILSHPELREAVNERHRAIDASWPDEPINHERAATIANLLTTEAYTSQYDPAAAAKAPQGRG
jgi:hypothetical protein